MDSPFHTKPAGAYLWAAQESSGTFSVEGCMAFFKSPWLRKEVILHLDLSHCYILLYITPTWHLSNFCVY